MVSVATSALWLLCGFIFRRGATARTGFFFGFQDIAYGGAYGGRAVTSAAQFSSVRCGYLSAPLMGPVGRVRIARALADGAAACRPHGERRAGFRASPHAAVLSPGVYVWS